MKLPLLVKQTLMRAGALVAVKTIGLAGKVFITRSLGMEGLGLYQLSYFFYALILMIISGGVPTALAIYTSGHPNAGWGQFKGFSMVLLLLGGGASLITFLESSWIASLLGYPQLDVVIRCLAPSLFAVPLLGLLRGYLQGLERYGIIAWSEIIEQSVRIGSLMLLIPLFIPSGLELAVGAAVLGTALGAIAAFAFLTAAILFKFPDKSPSPSMDYRTGFMTIAKVSCIISLTRLLVPASDFVDSLLIPQRLRVAGYSSLEAVQMLGVFTGIALVVAYMPTLFTGAITHISTMKISSDWTNRKYRQFNKRRNYTIDLAWVWGWASSCFIFCFSPEISTLLFGVPSAEPSIKMLAVIPLLAGLREVTTSILWAKNQKKAPFLGLAVGIAANFTILYAAVAVPGMGYAGIALGTITLELVSTLWNFKVLQLFSYIKTRLALYARDIVFFAALALLCIGSYKWLVPPYGIMIELASYLLCSALYFKIRFKRLL
ncbi:oligosaccharide flippase family protein [Paenibacillus sp. J22TS3]|uniref:oligosaccharide flippase family protein n=1 Tax=Paenibacillus sp. J22TS3 TaxID=2807192 RepID=UPI001B1DB8BD|nr:oligosaccharide flippase family protein [Paenibacillus sp. J22TS3]GIP23543.1 stage V sporulation protein B [Paenibacillus sp. J22TS3]